jgi:hypothetical protein
VEKSDVKRVIRGRGEMRGMRRREEMSDVIRVNEGKERGDRRG